MKSIYKLYVFFLPFGVFLNIPWFTEGVGNIFSPFSTLFMYLGWFVLMASKGLHIEQSDGTRAIFRLWLFMMAFEMLAVAAWSIFGTIPVGLEAPERAILGDVVLYSRIVLSVFFNYYCLSKVISFRELFRIFDWQLAILLCVVIFQTLAYATLSPFVGFYSTLSNYFSFVPLEKLWEMERGICLFESEPGHLTILCFLALPYSAYRLFFERGNFLKNTLYIASFILFILLSFFSGSARTIACFLGAFFFIFMVRLGLNTKILLVGALIVGMLSTVSLLFAEDINIKSDKESLEYALVGKAADTESLSTMMHASTIINDLKIFQDYPLTGVGDGLQGYFYIDNVPNWTKKSEEVKTYIYNRIMANGGGTFFPNYISGYGLIGILFLGLFVHRYRRCYNTSILTTDNGARLIFLSGMFVFLFAGWYGIGLKSNETLAFLLALPCIKLSSDASEGNA